MMSIEQAFFEIKCIAANIRTAYIILQKSNTRYTAGRDRQFNFRQSKQIQSSD